MRQQLTFSKHRTLFLMAWAIFFGPWAFGQTPLVALSTETNPGTTDCLANAVVADPAGGMVLGGTFIGQVDFNYGPGTTILSPVGGHYDAFIARYDASGALSWVFSFGGNGYNDVTEIKIDAVGNLVVFGYFTGTADFDPGPGVVNLTSVGNEDHFLAKYDSNGGLIWAKAVGGPNSEISSDFAMDAQDNLLITGGFSGTVDFDPGPGVYPITSVGLYNNLFVLKLDAGGNLLWAKSIHGIYSGYASGIDVGGMGELYLTGTFYGTMDFDPSGSTFNMTSNGALDVYLLRYDAAGNFQWGTSFGGPENDYSTSIEVGPAGNLHLFGHFRDSVDIDPSSGSNWMVSNGEKDVFLQQFDPSGNLNWSRTMGGVGYDDGFEALVAPSGEVFAVGSLSGPVDMDPGPGVDSFPGFSPTDAFLWRLDANGGYVNSYQLGGGRGAWATAVALGGNGDLLFTGQFLDTVVVDLPSGPQALFSNNYSRNAFLLRLGLCNATSDTMAVSACESFVSPGGNVYQQSGTYVDTLVNVGGCDSLLTIQLTVDAVDAMVTPLGGTLQAAFGAAAYQWLDCNAGYSQVAGANAQVYMPLVDGSYAVEVSSGMCLDTSVCNFVVGTSSGMPQGVRVYPNPTVGPVTIELGAVLEFSEVLVYNGLGQLTERFELEEFGKVQFDLEGPAGVYWVRLVGEKKGMEFKVVKK